MLKHSTLFFVALIVGCSSDPETTTAADTGAEATDTGAVATDTGGAAIDTGAAATDTGATAADTGAVTTDSGAPADTGAEVAASKPATPDVTKVMPMAGAWHVTWLPNDTGLSKIELWRSNDGAAATLVKAFGGTAKEWHDGAALGSTIKFCWTVRTFRGTEASDMSAAKCNK